MRTRIHAHIHRRGGWDQICGWWQGMQERGFSKIDSGLWKITSSLQCLKVRSLLHRKPNVSRAPRTHLHPPHTDAHTHTPQKDCDINGELWERGQLPLTELLLRQAHHSFRLSVATWCSLCQHLHSYMMEGMYGEATLAGGGIDLRSGGSGRWRV